MQISSLRVFLRMFSKLTIYIGVAGSIISLAALLSRHHLIFDLLSHFRVQYIFLIAPVLFLSLCSKTHFASGILLLGLVVHAITVTTSVAGGQTYTPDNQPVTRVMTSNLLASSRSYDEFIAFIQSKDPDVIVFQEYTGKWHDALSTALVQYRFKVTAPIETPFGIALYSKLPISEKSELALVRKDRPSIKATIEIADKLLTVIGTHPPPPISSALYNERNTHLQELATLAYISRNPTVILGDLNITPWSAHFSDLLKNGGLKSSRKGFGLFPTWPASLFVLQIPIDHILFSNSIYALSVGSGNKLQSDHKSLWADIQIK